MHHWLPWALLFFVVWYACLCYQRLQRRRRRQVIVPPWVSHPRDPDPEGRHLREPDPQDPV